MFAIVKRAVFALAPVTAAMAVATMYTIRFHGTMPADLDHRLMAGAFHWGHVWCFDHVYRMVAGLDAWGVQTTRLGFPLTGAARCLALTPALAVAPARAFLSPLGAYNLAILLTPAVAVLTTSLLLRRVTDLDRWSAGAAGVMYGVSPYVLGCFSGGQTCKAQVWGVPLVLWALAGVVRGPRRVLGIGITMVCGAILAGTDPTYALIVPFVAGAWALLMIRRPWLPHLAGAMVGLAALAAGLATAKLYYQGTDTTTMLEVFEPANRMKSHGIPIPTPMAQPWPTLWGPPPLQKGAGEPNHVTYIGVPLLIALVVGSVRSWRGRSLAWAAVVIGIVLALGEVLVSDNAYVLSGTQKLGLPALLLARYHYPLADSVMYYRSIVVASLGATMGAVGWVGGKRWGPFPAWGIAALALWDTHRVMAPVWPLHSRVHPTQLYAVIAADPVPGAVVEVPLVSNATEGGRTILDGAFLTRPVNGLVRFSPKDLPNVEAISAWFAEAAASDDAKGTLYSHGIRYVMTLPDTQARERATFTTLLGPPWMLDGRTVWRVGPAP